LKALFKLILTLSLITAAIYFGYQRYRIYIQNPWTRDGQVRTQVVQITPRVSGTITHIYIQDNQKVHKGDLLFEIDSAPYILKVKQAQARLQRVLQSAKSIKIEYERVKKIYQQDHGAISQKELLRHETNYFKSLSDIQSATESLNSAKLNLSYTKVYAKIDGYVSNINFQIGSQANVGKPILALVDPSSYWVFGFFTEDKIKHINIGDEAIVTLMAYPNTPLKGKVESIGWGIALNDGNAGANLLPNIKPTFQWIRLAQRLPVRIKLENVPSHIKLRFGLSASVIIKHPMTDTQPTLLFLNKL
jgi:multidrug resistance efflux pump